MVKQMSSQSGRPWGYLISLLFNSLCLVIIGKQGQLLKNSRNSDNLQGLGWSRKAAEEAEAASQYSCSGHGYVFVDTFHWNQDGTPTCECNECYMGLNCSQIDPDCVSNADSGDPGFLEPFWIANAEVGATVIPAWYRMSYIINDVQKSVVSPELEKQIHDIHALVGNAVTEGRYIVLKIGSMHLINAVVNSLVEILLHLSPRHSLNPAQVVAASPFYGGYGVQTELFDSGDNIWTGDGRAWTERTESLNSTTFIEFVTSPNNPDTLLDEAVLEGKNVKTVYDHAYYWPHFTAISRPADEDIMLFTLSKLTGHAGSRLGWAIIKDYDVYQKIYKYVATSTFGVSHDTQLRATTLLKAVISGYRHIRSRTEAIDSESKQMIFHYAYSVMRRRWERLERILNMSDRFSLQNVGPLYCNFFRKVTGPSPAYAWVKCEKEEEEEDCAAVLEKAGIIGRGAEAFGADKRYVRLSLLRRDDAFAVLERRLQSLICYNNHCEDIFSSNQTDSWAQF
ncbi:tryptophan aminotransferase-related protein 3-like [Cryptomeria japonica]|uniref:tryptophan aminotransferase-related protein 3-like n=1 Tax=Cryptomeria japonica TaxID=3369 RepID=UPI0027D9DC91|nr:tryptophan aminotransferase-related protein 3-like [Cryptomeria japonica]